MSTQYDLHDIQPACENIEHDLVCHECEVEPSDCNYFMQGNKLEDFIRLSSLHAATCGSQLKLVERVSNFGCYLKQVWRCSVCNAGLELENCDMVRSEAVADGAAYSRKQPDFNLRIVKGAALVGINTTKLQEFLEGQMGIQTPTERNLRTQITKVRDSIKRTFEIRKVENRIEHNEAIRANESYRGDLEWEMNGQKHSTSVGDISHDGAGCTRSYNHRHKGRQSAFVVNSMNTGKPLALVVSQVSLVGLVLYKDY